MDDKELQRQAILEDFLLESQANPVNFREDFQLSAEEWAELPEHQRSLCEFLHLENEAARVTSLSDSPPEFVLHPLEDVQVLVISDDDPQHGDPSHYITMPDPLSDPWDWQTEALFQMPEIHSSSLDPYERALIDEFDTLFGTDVSQSIPTHAEYALDPSTLDLISRESYLVGGNQDFPATEPPQLTEWESEFLNSSTALQQTSHEIQIHSGDDPSSFQEIQQFPPQYTDRYTELEYLVQGLAYIRFVEGHSMWSYETKNLRVHYGDLYISAARIVEGIEDPVHTVHDPDETDSSSESTTPSEWEDLQNQWRIIDLEREGR